MLATTAPLLIGFLVSVTMMLALRPVALQLRLVDVPGGRKTHRGEVPVIGGISIFLGMLGAVLATPSVGDGASAIVVAAAVMVLVGAMDDRYDLPANVRILAHVAAVMTLVIATEYRVGSLGDLLGFGVIDLGAFSFMFTVVAAIALINGFNMLDGLDGLAGGVALVGLAGLAVGFLGKANASALIVALSLVGSIAAFLLFNLPARFNRPVLAFMGDAGSTLLGFVIAGLALQAIQPNGPDMPAAVVLWLLPIPIFELFTSTFRRAVTGLSPMQADRGHFHHKLLEAGFSVRAIFIWYSAVSTASAGFGIWAWRHGIADSAMFYGFLVFTLAWLLTIRHARRVALLLPVSLRRARFPPRRRRRGTGKPALQRHDRPSS